MEEKASEKKIILALVGMPGAGKSEATSYLEKKGIPFIRFGQITDEKVKELGLELTPENEKTVREQIRNDLGMAAYAILAKPKIDDLVSKHPVIVIDGLYSWEEYIYLKKIFPNLILIHIYAEPKIRYERLSSRTVRPIIGDEAPVRDHAEIEKLNKGGPIAIADYLIENNEEIEKMFKKIDTVLARLHIAFS